MLLNIGYRTKKKGKILFFSFFFRKSIDALTTFVDDFILTVLISVSNSRFFLVDDEANHCSVSSSASSLFDVDDHKDIDILGHFLFS